MAGRIVDSILIYVVHAYIHTFLTRHVQSMEPKTFYEISDLIAMQRKAGNSAVIEVSVYDFR